MKEWFFGDILWWMLGGVSKVECVVLTLFPVCIMCGGFGVQQVAGGDPALCVWFTKLLDGKHPRFPALQQCHQW